MKKILWGGSGLVLVGTLGSYFGAVLLKWAPAEVLWELISGSAMAIWNGLVYTVPFPLSLLVLLLLPYLLIIGWIIWVNLKDRNRAPAVGAPIIPQDPATHYLADAIFDVMWSWRWGHDWRTNRVIEGLHPLCPRKTCRSDMIYDGFLGGLMCKRCRLKRYFKTNPEDRVRIEIVSRARTGDWINAERRIEELNPPELPTGD